MRIFLRNALKFILPYATALAVIAVWALYSEIKLYRSNIRIAPDVRYVVVGDSQSEMAVDPEYFPHLANHSIAALSLDQSLYKIRDLLSTNADRDFTIILDVSPKRMVHGDQPLTASDFESRYALLNFIHFFSPRRKIGEPIKILRDRIVKSAFKHLTHKKFTKKRNKLSKNPWGGFQPRNEKRWLSNPEETANEARQYISESLTEAASSTEIVAHNMAILDEIITTVKANGKEIILLTTPWHGSLLDGLSQKLITPFSANMQMLADQHGLKWLNTIEWHTPDDGWLNQNHLNANGAILYTTYLREQISKEN